MSLSYRTEGNSKPWQHRPSDHLLGNRLYIHGPIQPMQPPSWWERLFGR
jgi:hypothetical protein